MNRVSHCAVVIPCLNEAAAIKQVVTAARIHVPAVFVVDDGSNDSTADLAAQAGAQILRHEIPQGKGSALRTGLMHVREHGFSRALTMDGDGQHAPEDIPKFLNCAAATGADLVVGNRMVHPETMPPLRRFVNRWMSARISKLTGLPLSDSQCGFRLMNLVVWSALPLAATHFEVESEVLLQFALAGRRIKFVPIQVIYKGEQSKIHPVRDTIRWWSWWRRSKRLVRERRIH